MPKNLHLDGKLREFLHRHSLEDGRVPAERELAEALHCSRVAVRAAMSRLAAAGEVRRIHGRGTFLTELPESRRVSEKSRFQRAILVYPYYVTRAPKAFPSEVFMGVLQGAMRAHCAVDFVAMTSRRSWPRLLEYVHAQKEVVGLLAFWITDEDLLSDLARLPMVRVMIDHYQGAGFKKVLPDEADLARQVLDHLRKLGHRRVSVAYLDRPGANLDRLDALREEGRDLGLDAERAIIPLKASSGRPTNVAQTGYELGEQLLAAKRRSSALIMLDEALAEGVVRHTHDTGRSIPRDLSLITVADHDEPRLGGLRLTRFVVDGMAIGNRAVRVLLAATAQDDRSEAEVRIPGKLVVGNSTGLAP